MKLKKVFRGFIEYNKILKKLSKDGKKVLTQSFNEESILGQCMNLNILSKLFVAEPRDYPKLYHYTTLDGFKGICSTKEIRTGSQIYMNDPWERKYVFDLAYQYLKSLGISKEESNEFINEVNENPYDVYVWSFTDNSYSQALQLYGDVALGFNSKDIFNFINRKFTTKDIHYGEQMDFDMENVAFAMKVIYDYEIQEKYVCNIAYAWLSAFRNYKGSNDVKDIQMKEIMEGCQRALFLFSLCFKNFIYRQEEEIRYVVLKYDPYRKQAGVRKTADGRLYVPLKFDPKILKKVIISTPLYNKMGGTGLFNQILKKNGFNNIKAEKKILDY